jgi:hypothetical protein
MQGAGAITGYRKQVLTLLQFKAYLITIVQEVTIA